MLAISISINIFLLPILAIISVVLGYSFRSYQLQKLNKQVSSLEKEMLNSHAEILNLQQELARVSKKNTAPKSLVVSMKEASGNEEDKETISEANRKQAK